MLQRRDLSYSRCLELLSSRGVGRVAVSSPDGPLIYPVNYTLLDADLWLRLPAQSAIATQIGARTVVAVEVGEIDEKISAGWTVQVRGQALGVDDPEVLEKVRDAWYPRPFAVAGRFHYLRLPLDDVLGREVASPAHDPNAAGIER